MLAWKGPTGRSPDGYKLREEIELSVGADPGRLLQALGYRAVHAIDREVEIWHLDGATARLERYPRMDVLVEVEGEPAAIERAVAASGIPRARVHRRVADRVRPPLRGAHRRHGRARRRSAATPLR